MRFEELEEFLKDKKKLTKRYRSIPDDIETVKQVLEVKVDESPPFSFRLNNLGLETCVIKVKKIACKSLKGKGVNSGLRLVYAYFKTQEEKEQEEKIVFVELYHKSDKEWEDRDRILRCFE